MLTFLGILPLQIAVAPDDSTETNFRISGGFGQYAQIFRGCEGEVLDKEKMPFSEIGLSIDHKTRSCFQLGLNTSSILTRKGSEYNQDSRRVEIVTINPFVNA